MVYLWKEINKQKICVADKVAFRAGGFKLYCTAAYEEIYSTSVGHQFFEIHSNMNIVK